MARKRSRYRRGYPLAVLVGLEEKRAVLWQVFSEVAKLDGIVEHKGAERGGSYDFHESIVNALRPILREGVKSVVIAAPPRTDCFQNLLDHIRKHHAWLVQEGPSRATFGRLVGSAGQPHKVHELVRTREFRDAIGETTSRDAENIAADLETSLASDDSGTVVSYSLEEIEDLVYDRKRGNLVKPEHIVLTNKCLADTEKRGRILRLLQISKNKGIKITIVNAENKAGLRIAQLGGLLCFAKPE